MSIGEGVGEVDAELQCTAHVQCAAVDHRPERLPLHELEHEEGPIPLLADIEQHRDVRVRQSHQPA